MVVAFKPLGDSCQLLVDFGHQAGQFAQGQRCADARHYVLPLGIEQELAVELLVAGGWVARESDSRGRVLPQVAEDHELHIDCCAQVVRDLVHPAVGAGAGSVPGAKDGVAGHT